MEHYIHQPTKGLEAQKDPAVYQSTTEARLVRNVHSPRKACLSVLPDEILLEICEHLEVSSNFSLVSHRYRGVALEVLFHRISLRNLGEARRFLRLVINAPHIALHVKHLSVDFFDFVSYFDPSELISQNRSLPHPFDDEDGLLRELYECGMCPLWHKIEAWQKLNSMFEQSMRALLQRLPALRTLEHVIPENDPDEDKKWAAELERAAGKPLLAPWFLSMGPTYVPPPPLSPPPAPPPPQSVYLSWLRSFKFVKGSVLPGETMTAFTSILPVLFLPSIQEVGATCLKGRHPSRISRFVAPSLYRTSRVTSIDLEGCCLSSSVVEELLQLPIKLKRFSYAVMPNTWRCKNHQIRGSNVGKLLCRFASDLEELRVWNFCDFPSSTTAAAGDEDIENDFAEWQDDTTEEDHLMSPSHKQFTTIFGGSLEGFTKLRKLEIPLGMIFGTRGMQPESRNLELETLDKGNGNFQLIDELPSCLELLRVQTEVWGMMHSTFALKELLERKSRWRKMPVFRELIVEGGRMTYDMEHRTHEYVETLAEAARRAEVDFGFHMGRGWTLLI
ncbi:hypothetical protein BDZ91DRAFT_794422 [Kalaharituber pfeilii]|nr:hypothetical protein BDZ91DRAFT_794422 [Kalaharituber pfeilii]